MLFEEIYENYFKDVCRLSFSLTKDEVSAEDLAQETFVKALASIDSFDGSKDIRAWLFTIAKNTFYSECRKRKWISDDELPEEIPSPEQDFLEVISDKERAVLIHKYLHSMKDPYKEVFHLRVFGELDFEVIGNIFGKSASWARVTFYRAKNEIKNYMSEIGET
ncbi:RNA polymerase sigma-70 factor (ECF subfamily) [Ruminococcaceae bacterium R-25]|nr:RNA polymerase sigma-70 factor (ECF subfamily) [Ruminococcaceae bacterium R-25]SUQ21833.1 RNA polymerase sigma-70 factor, ECF subfamily [Oscillospiraceae bacterium]